METTKLSTKGQIVIPESLREGIEAGTVFIVTRTNKMIILKEIDGLTEKEKEEIKELDKIWKDIDEGRGVSIDVDKFLNEMDQW